MFRRGRLIGLGILAALALAVPASAARPVVGPQQCKYNAHIMYDYDCDGSFEVGVNDLYSTPAQCQNAVHGLVQHAQHYGFCWALPPVNCLPTPSGCYAHTPADPNPPAAQ